MKRILLPVAVGLAVFAVTFAFAASLGGVSSGKVGAGDTVVAACDTDGVTTSFSSAAWDATDERYEIGQVTVGGVSDDCDGSVLKLTLTDSSGAQLGEATLNPIPTSGATSFTLTLASPVAAAAVEGVHVVIGS